MQEPFIDKHKGDRNSKQSSNETLPLVHKAINLRLGIVQDRMFCGLRKDANFWDEECSGSKNLFQERFIPKESMSRA